MKGTLFSADFVKDSDSNLRLLELNTDTGFITNTLSSRFDFDEFIGVLSNNTITELVIIYKVFQTEFVDLLKTTIANDATFITTVTEQIESESGIYPTAPTDSDDKFILRLAYDENALFDSTYCKQRANLQKLFYDNSATGSIPNFYYSGSEGIIDTLNNDINDHDILPDFVVKPISEEHTPLEFYNVGGSESSSADRVANFMANDFNINDSTIEKFHYNPSEVNSESKVNGLRVIGVVYGDNIDHILIGQWKVYSFFNIPTSEELAYLSSNGTDNTVKYADKHYFQLTSNWIRKTDGEGIYVGTGVLRTDDSSVNIETIETGSIVKSIFINGLPDEDLSEMYYSWTSSGNELPSGSFITSSTVETMAELKTNKSYGIVGEMKLSDEDMIYSTVGKHYLVYSTGSNEMSFKSQYQIDENDHFLVGPSGSLIPIQTNKLIVLEDNVSGSLYRIDVETTDTYFLSSSVSPLVVHNAPCFVAGTWIEMEESGSTKKIEDVTVGERVWTWNHTSNQAEVKEVKEVMVKENQDTVIYTTEKGEVIQCTLDHPFYIQELNDYASHTPSLTLEDSGLTVKQIEVGHTLQHIDYGLNLDHDGDVDKIESIELGGKETVYNLKNVEDNHNFYAMGFLVHNRYGGGCFAEGTQISLSNGDEKNIEDIVVGDEVIGWKDGKRSNGIVSELKPTYLGDRSLYGINDLTTRFTDSHPFLTKDGWKSISPDEGTEYGLLVVGDEINHEGEWITINEFKETEGENYKQLVYNFTVEEIHSYIADGIVVHNK